MYVRVCTREHLDIQQLCSLYMHTVCLSVYHVYPPAPLHTRTHTCIAGAAVVNHCSQSSTFCWQKIPDARTVIPLGIEEHVQQN